MFEKILIANRGEIAIRIMKAANEMGIETVAIYSEADADALHLQYADEAYQIGEGNELKDTYLNINRIIDIAKLSGVEAIHPGYGFLSENPEFVAACERDNIRFIGPHTRAIQLMGNKIESRNFVKEIGIPMTEAVSGDLEDLLKAADTIPFPLLVKAAAGGGGKGMRIVRSREELKEAIESTSREAGNYFGDPSVFVEKYVEEPRHIEIQVIGDNFGNVVHLYERECSIQRRHQKIIEESPSATITPEVREKMGKAAVEIARKIEYNSAGTVEFLLDKDMHFYFLEMNTRIQVEHPVTEEVTAIDLVQEQISIAAGNQLSFTQEEIRQEGHAIECRIYAEDPENNFLPSPGEITFLREPQSFDLRIDAAINDRARVHSFFDPMISKLIIWGENRAEAITAAELALRNYVIDGIKTNIPYLIQIIRSQEFKNNQISTKYCELHTGALIENIHSEKNDISKEMIFAIYLAISLEEDRLLREEIETFDTLSVWENIGYWRELLMFSGFVDENEYTAEVTIHDGFEYRIQMDTLVFEIENMDLKVDVAGFELNGQSMEVIYSLEEGRNLISFNGHNFILRRNDFLEQQDTYVSMTTANGDAKIVSPMPGKVIKIIVSQGQEVKKGEVLLIVEAMKMENNIIAPKDGKIKQINVQEGEMVDGSLELISLEEEE